MSTFRLTPGSCAQLQLSPYDGEAYTKEHVVQFLSVKKVGPGTSDRYRLIISDGTHFIQAMLATQCNALVESEEIKRFTVAAIERATCNTVQEKRLVILLSVRVLGSPNEKIGEPLALLAGQEANPTADSGPAAVSAPEIASTSSAPQLTPPVIQNQQGNKGHTNSPTTFPIEGLSPYQNNWTIKARVTQKSEMKTWSNPRGEGKLFNVTLMDETGEIKATAFNTVADELFSRLEENKVYYLSKARVNFAKKKFSNLSNNYELSLDRNTQIEECHEAAGVPQFKFNFIPLDQLETLGKDSVCDVIGVIKEIGDPSEITTKQTNRQLHKRELTLVDKTGYSVQMTLWGRQAQTFDTAPKSVAAFKGVKVGDFGGVSLSMMTSSLMQVDPPIEECFTLRGWYDSQGADMSFQSKTVIGGGGGLGAGFNRAEVRSLNEVKESELGMGDKPEIFSAQATIVHIREESVSYPACTGANCSKKMVMNGDNWVCDKCGHVAPSPEYRYILSMAVADWSGQAWLQGFNDAGRIIFGMSANELHDIKMDDENKFNAIVHKANCRTYNFACRAKKDSFDERVRVRYGITRIEPFNYLEEANHLLDALRSPWAQ